MLSETEGAISKLDVEVEYIEKIKNGEAPPPPEPTKGAELAVIPVEPVIRIVEVSLKNYSYCQHNRLLGRESLTARHLPIKVHCNHSDCSCV